MRFTLQLPTDKVQCGEEFLGPGGVGELARAAEAAGFDACFVTDHPIPDDRWLAAGGHHALDPFVALAFAAAATERIRLQTHILVGAYRNPFMTAKSIASLDVLSGGRVIVGMAAGYLEPEFRALGADFEGRGARCDEAIDVMKRVWSEDGIVLEGEGFAAAGNTALPRPLQSPHPPIWIGGNSRAAMRRAVERGDGWLPFPAPPRLAKHVGTAALSTNEELAQRVAELGDLARERWRAPLEVCFAPLELRDYCTRSLDATPFREALAALEAIGVGWCTISLPGDTRVAFLAELERFGKEVIAP